MSHKDDVTVWDDLTVQDVTEETGRQPHTAERRTGEVAVSQTRLLDVSSFMWAVEELSPFHSLHVPLISHLSPSHPLFPPCHTFSSLTPPSLLPPSYLLPSHLLPSHLLPSHLLPSCRQAIFLLWNKRCSLMSEADQPAPLLSLRNNHLREYLNVCPQN